MQKVIVYGAAWCGDCTRTKFFLDKHKIEYEYIDIDKVDGAIDIVRKYNNYEFDSIPVVVFEDGSFLIEPRYEDLLKKFNILE